MKSRKRMGWLLLPLLIGLLGGCASLPAPEEGADTLLVIPVELKQAVSSKVFGKIYVRLLSEDQQIDKYHSIDPLSKYALVEGLPAGKYRIVEAEFRYNDLNKGNKVALNLGFELEPGNITILHHMCTYELHQEGNTYWTRYGWNALSKEVTLRVLEKLSAEETFSAWGLSAHTRDLSPVIQARQDLGI